MLQHSPTCCNTVQHVAAQYTTLQHGATCCNPVQHVATQCTISQDRLALGRLNRTAAIDALCENVLSIMRFYRLCLCEGPAGGRGHGRLGRRGGRVFRARGARTRGLCGGEGSMWLIGRRLTVWRMTADGLLGSELQRGGAQKKVASEDRSGHSPT
jgi:hypothetical protein